MLKGSAGQILLNSLLPEDLRDYNRTLNGKETSKLFSEIAKRYPDRYSDIVDDVLKAGHQTAYWTGNTSFDIKHLHTPQSVKNLRKELGLKTEKIWQNRNLDRKAKQAAVLQIASEYQDKIADLTLQESEKEGNPFAMHVLSGARGNKMNLSSLRGSDVLYADHRKNPIPVPVLRSYSEGLEPHEYFAGTFGARSGLAETKLAVADTGFLCLATGTMVAMADGSAKAIEDIQIGDIVVGADKLGKTNNTRVVNKYDNGLRNTHKFTFRRLKHGGEVEFSITATGDHKVLTISRSRANRTKVVTLAEVTIEELFLLMEDGEKAFLIRDQYLGETQTWDIEVDNEDHLFVLENGAIVSNSKQFVQSAHRLMVTEKDGRGPHDDTIRGYPVKTENPHNEGALLAHSVGGYPRNTVLTPKVLSDLKTRKIENILIRSPIVGGPMNGGVYAYDVGVREKGKIAPMGDFVGIAAAQALSEGVTQGTLGAKHGGGVAGTSKVSSGYKAINQAIQVPKIFPGGATHSQEDGKVQSIEDAPQGGKYIYINGQKHYVHQGFEPKVKIGQEVEAGDIISEGMPNPAEIVSHKGIGEGRRYFIDILSDIYRQSGMPAHRRNLEIISRGLINHVRLTQENGSFVPDDVRPYSYMEYHYEPREGHKVVDPRQAKGMYLEKPYLHYSIGTKVRPSVIKNLGEYGVKQIAVHADPAPFEPEMIRGLEVVSNDPDWMTRFLGSHVKKNFLRGVHRGHMSDERGTSYVPSLARAVDFNKFPPVKGYDPAEPPVMKHPVRKSLLEGLGNGGMDHGETTTGVNTPAAISLKDIGT